MTFTMEEKIMTVLSTDWKPSYELVKVNTPKGWLGNSADRIARYMALDGKIERKRDGKYAFYKLKQQATLFS
jgi:hypothetical protein